MTYAYQALHSAAEVLGAQSDFPLDVEMPPSLL